MKKLILSMMLLGSITSASAQTVTTMDGTSHHGVYTKLFIDPTFREEAETWFNAGKWRNGFTKGEAHESVNIYSLYEQYQKNPDSWKNAFKWLQETDLATIPAGRYIIPHSNMVASVEDGENEDFSKRQTESHQYNIDFMLVVDGTEGFLRLDHQTSTLATKYKYDVVRYGYKPECAEYLQVPANRFVIMFPDDWHVAKVKTKQASQKLRVVVIKVPYVF